MSDPLYIDGLPPVKAHPDDAAWDLRSQDNALIEPYSSQLIDCGFAVAVPEGHVGMVCSRSGLALKNHVFVLNAPGIIDPGYRGNVGVILFNLSPKDFVVRPGDRIAQLLIIPAPSYQLVQSKNMLEQPTARGEGGFGSTGIITNPESVITFPLGSDNPFAPKLNINCESCGSPECREGCMT